MADIELTHFQFTQRKCQNLQPQVARPSFNFKSPTSGKAPLGAAQTGTDWGSKNKPLPLEPDYALFSPVPGEQENALQTLQSRGPFTPTEGIEDIIAFGDPGQQNLGWIDGASEDDNLDEYSECRLLLKRKSPHTQKRRRISTMYQKGPLRTYYHSAKALLLAQVHDIGRFFLSSRKSGGMELMFVRYDQIPQSLITSYISEEQFWLSLKRFFGLLPLPDQLVGSFPNCDELTYISNYLKSKPTPGKNGNKGDDGRDLVRICTKLTTFIFRNRESKRIFLDVDSRIYCRPKSFTWEIFQGFGLIHQFCDEPESKQHTALYQDEWLQARNIPLPKRQHMLKIWDSLRHLLSEGRQAKQSDPTTTMRGGLFQIYHALSTSEVNSPGRFGIEFSHFSGWIDGCRWANVCEWPTEQGAGRLGSRCL